jgi:hypothetical protein
VAYDPTTDKEIIERRRSRVEVLRDSLAKDSSQIRLL